MDHTFHRRTCAVLSVLLATVGQQVCAATVDPERILRIEVSPETIALSGRRQSMQIVVTGHLSDGGTADITRDVVYTVSDPVRLSVSPNGQVRPSRNGPVLIHIQLGLQSLDIPVTVSGQDLPDTVSFDHQTLPALAKAGCSGGACHGSPNGKAGFRLSLFGFQPEFDRRSLVRDLRNRRINFIEPEKSLVLRKPTMDIPHAGGRRLRKGDGLYELFHDWIAEGCRTTAENVQCVGIDVFPAGSRVLRFPAHAQQFRVSARFSDGSTRDVTPLAQFSLSNPDVATVSQDGVLTGTGRGETAVIIRYLEFIQTPLLTLVRDVEQFRWDPPPVQTYVDRHIDTKLKQIQYLPSSLCSDQVFLRRVFLDVIGLLPTPDETLQFLADDQPDKRRILIDELLERPEFARFQAQKWGDLLRVSRKQIGTRSVFKYSRWLEGAIATGMSYDEFARKLITASGSTLKNPAANYYRTAGDTMDAMETTAQVFLGTRMQCAKCHNHPFERWTQTDYYGLAAYFTRIQRRKTASTDEVIMLADRSGEVRHPADGRIVPPAVPAGSPAREPNSDRRLAFVDWLTSKDNPYFARVEVNRIWAQLMGRGIVEPFDDFRDSNPPSNASLLDALAQDFVEHGYDRVHIFRAILNSRTYQTSSQPNRFNHDDTRYFSHYVPRRMTAEQLVDALSDVTGSPEEFPLVVAGTRATWLPAPDLQPHNRAKLGDIEFLKVFGQPERQSVCECDRGDDTSLGQALELLNGGFLHRKLENTGNRFHQALQSGTAPEQIMTRLYLQALCRQPDRSELQASLRYFAGHTNKALAMEDICWAIVNKDEFLFQH